MEKQPNIISKQPSIMRQEIMRKLAKVQSKLKAIIDWQLTHSGRI